MPKFAANLSLMFAELGFLERFGAARANGFEAVEFLFPYAFDARDIAERLAATGLQLVLHNLPAGDWAAGERGIACHPDRVAEFKDGVALALAYAGKFKVRQLHCLAGLMPADVSPATAHATYVANLRYAAARLGAHGMRLLIEPINTFDMPGYFLSGSAQAAGIIAECGAGNLFMQYDMYHMQRMEGALAATIRARLPLIKHFQLADVPGRHEPGTGAIDFPQLFRLLDELGYDGWIGCEYHPLGETVAGLGWRTTLSA
ncbi:MAG: hydroxypyruvate isomerase [Massilia sp.]|nr:hydroxypyruvate isomerase [Massilia sp.]